MTATARHAQVVFLPSGHRGRMPLGSNVLEAARALGVDIDSVCGGRGICGRCQVEVGEGGFPKLGLTSSGAHLTDPGPVELDYAGRRPLAPGRRLSCAADLLGDCVIDVPPESQVHRPVVRKSVELREIAIDPVVRLHYVEVEEPALASPSGDLARLLAALEREWSLVGLRADLDVVRTLQPALAAGRYRVTAAVHDGSTITAVWPGFRDEALGVAVDVGSTTVAAYLADLASGEVLASAGTMNPQIRFGEDLMSRVSYVMLNPGGDRELTRVVRDAVNGLLRELADGAGRDPADILELAIVGNPIMHHLLLGIDPTPLGGAPFTLATEHAVRAAARDLGLAAHPGARVYLLPCIAGHVGADTAGAILSETPHRGEAIQLLVDVGTNAEIVLGNRDRLLAASSPTGPAFEGAQISCGQRAAPGAIERVRIDPETLEPRFRVIGVRPWSDEPGFGRAVRRTGITGVCGSGIIEVIAEMFLAGIVTPDGVIDGSLAARSPRIVPHGRTFAYLLHDGEPRLTVTQNDVRAIQLAKAALYAGTRLLMDHLGIEAVDEIRLAGAFGSHIDVVHAMVLGLIPDCPVDRVRSVGNAAGTGALIALLSAAARAEIEEVVRGVEKIETAVEPRFQEHFVDAMALPHRTAAFPNLERIVRLPARRAEGRATVDARAERRRRRLGEPAAPAGPAAAPSSTPSSTSATPAVVTAEDLA